jgi:hypothetical protein
MGTLRYLTILLFTGLSISNLSGQTTSEQIKAIRREFQTINADTTLRKITLENEEFLGDNIGDGGGELKGFYKGKAIKKIHLWLGLSNGTESKEFYFQDGQLIFVYEKFKTFGYDEKKGQMDYDKTTTTFEGRYYFKNQKLISQSTKGQNRHDDEAADPSVFLEQANEDLNLLNKKI